MRKIFLPSLLVIFISILAYANTLGHGFVWDDYIILLQNKWIKESAGFNEIFLSDFCKGFDEKCGFYRPLVTLSYLIDYSIWEFNPMGYRLTNILIHTGASLFVYLLALRLIQIAPPGSNNPPLPRGIALGAGIVFAILPIHAESIAYIAARTDPPATFLILASFLFFMAFRKKGEKSLIWYGLSCFSFALALLTKEISVMFPFLLIIFDLFFHKVNKKKFLEKYRALIPFFLLLIPYFIIRRLSVGYGMAPDLQWQTLPNRLLEFPALLVGYLKIMAIPVPLTVFQRPPSVQDHIFIDGIIPWAILFILIYFGVKKLKSYPLYGFSLSWIVVSLFPVLNIIPINFTQGDPSVVERYAYLSSVGFSIFLPLLVFEFKVMLKQRSIAMAKGGILFLSVLFFSFFIIILLHRNSFWKNDMTLWGNEAQREKAYFIAYYNYGTLLTKNGRLEEAKIYYLKSIAAKPNDFRSYLRLAEAYEKENNLDEALRTYGFIQKTFPRLFQPPLKLGVIYFQKGNLERALENLQEALSRDPNSPQARTLLGRVRMAQNKPGQAIMEYQRALSSNPMSAEIHFHLGTAYQTIGDFKNAEAHFLASLELEPGQWITHKALGLLYFEKAGQIELAGKHLAEAKRLNPGRDREIEKALENLKR